jgi:hypothetical protein
MEGAMRSQPTIIVLKMREILYTLLLVFLVGLLILCMVLMFTRKATGNGQNQETQKTGSITCSVQNSCTSRLLSATEAEPAYAGTASGVRF